jgi:hypothetical protein
MRFRIAVAGHILLTGVLVYFWAQVVPILIRPIYTWHGAGPPVSAMAPLQESGWVPVVAAVLASFGRMLLQGISASRPERTLRMDVLEQRLATDAPVVPLAQRVPPWGRVVGQALWVTLLLSGMLESWIDAFLLWALIVLIQAARAGLVSIPLGPWPRWMAKIPLLFRLITGFVAVGVLSAFVLPQVLWQFSFRPIAILTAIALVVLYLLVPGVPGVPRQQQ